MTEKYVFAVFGVDIIQKILYNMWCGVLYVSVWIWMLLGLMDNSLIMVMKEEGATMLSNLFITFPHVLMRKLFYELCGLEYSLLKEKHICGMSRVKLIFSFFIFKFYTSSTSISFLFSLKLLWNVINILNWL